MCGIVGIIGDQDNSWIEAMNDVQAHRGPDDFGVYSDKESGVTLAQRRLSILDLSGGHQPMFSEDRSICVVYNGEIFNAPELRVQLEQKGYKFFTSNSDTEVILKMYEDIGEECVKHFNGMFAFVIHDKKNNRIFGARDQVGIKPLYYSLQSGRMAFASELKSILQLPYISRDINYQSLYHYMTLLYIPDQHSIIDGVFRLPPGSSFTYDLDTKQYQEKRFWKPCFRDNQIRDEQELIKQLRKELNESVSRWTLSDVPIACSLSGGIDSSAIIGLLSEAGHKNVKTFSLGFEGEKEAKFNELDLAKQVADRWGTEHNEIILKPDDLLGDLIDMVWHLDEPYAGGLPSWYVYKVMGQEVKVGLTGSGGDELFGNYGKWKFHNRDWLIGLSLSLRNKSKSGSNLFSALTKPISGLAAMMPSSLPLMGEEKVLGRMSKTFREPFGKAYYAMDIYFSDERKKSSVFANRFKGMDDTSTLMQAVYDEHIPIDIKNGMAAVDFQTQLPEEFLFMTDRFSMAHHLEARVPLLDQKLIDFTFGIPSSIRTSDHDLKYLLKASVQDLLPEDLLKARKRGFVIPVEHWISGDLKPLVQKLISPERLKSQGIFNPEFYQEFVQPHLDGKSTWTWQIWAMLMFQLWYIMYIENNQKTKPTYGWQDI